MHDGFALHGCLQRSPRLAFARMAATSTEGWRRASAGTRPLFTCVLGPDAYESPMSQKASMARRHQSSKGDLKRPDRDTGHSPRSLECSLIANGIEVLPEDVELQIFYKLDAPGLTSLSGCCRSLRSFLQDQHELWKCLALHVLHPFSDNQLEMLRHLWLPRQPQSSHRASPWLKVPGAGALHKLHLPRTWRQVLTWNQAQGSKTPDAGANVSSREILVIDVGLGGAKFGFAPGLPRSPAHQPAMQDICLCQSSQGDPAEAQYHHQLTEILKRMKAQKCPDADASLERSSVVVRISEDSCMKTLIGEPFALFSDAEAANWRAQFALPQLPPRERDRAAFVPQALMALIAHEAPSDGVVINLGYCHAVSVPVLGGSVLRDCARQDISCGGQEFTARLLEALEARGREAIGQEHLGWCCGLKETHCFVAPECLESSLQPEVATILLKHPDTSQPLELGAERFLIPELLFSGADAFRIRFGAMDGVEYCGLVGMVVATCAAAVSAAEADEAKRVELDANLAKQIAAGSARLCPGRRASLWRRLLGSVVVVGGTGELPGLRERLRRDLRRVVEDPKFEKVMCLDQDLDALRLTGADIRVLEPLEPHFTPRTAVFYGGTLLAAAGPGAVEFPPLAVQDMYAPAQRVAKALRPKKDPGSPRGSDKSSYRRNLQMCSGAQSDPGVASPSSGARAPEDSGLPSPSNSSPSQSIWGSTGLSSLMDPRSLFASPGSRPRRTPRRGLHSSTFTGFENSGQMSFRGRSTPRANPWPATRASTGAASLAADRILRRGLG
eukprot:gnl/MRDRNA2_/MRDRNA2_33740_c0_seq1.p1 gnl/MRDRNA2_/MRDRNA2_33740_c0~~gnl/MRDRNA2_/MRDRNA2_33740_c0_seq1.p1  ORF type:complete len:786 (-),score=118.41 gnl/MRDRNA2_/MRDRNA2_33740_c0_seq1:126-2483(-)